MNNITWVDLQKGVKETFADCRMGSFKDVLEKDRNGWNWILSFDLLESSTTLLIHVKFIFKLDEDKKKLRLNNDKNEFLYLYDLNCKYRVQPFSDLINLKELIKDILMNDRFGENLLAVSAFMVSPSKAINKYFYENKVLGLSVFEVEYEPTSKVVPCQSLSIDFKFNVNNKIDVKLEVLKEGDGKFTLIFEHQEKRNEVEIDELNALSKSVAWYIQKNFATEEQSKEEIE